MLLLLFILQQLLSGNCCGSTVSVVMTAPGQLPADDWHVELQDSQLDIYHDFTVCGRVKNYKFRRSSDTSVWETILATDQENYLSISIPIDCENKYVGCTENYKYYLGKD